MDGEFVIIDGLGHVLMDDAQWSEQPDDAEVFVTVESARAARPGHADGTATSRVVFKNQVKRFQLSGCLTGGQCRVPHSMASPKLGNFRPLHGDDERVEIAHPSG